MTVHLDDSLLLRHLRSETAGSEATKASRHLADCSRCRQALGEVREVDKKLRALTQTRRLERLIPIHRLPGGDPFRRRPRIQADRTELTPVVLEASDAGLSRSVQFVESIRDRSDLMGPLKRFDFDRPEDRFTVYFALQEAARKIAEKPSFALDLAIAVLALPAPDRKTTARAAISWDSVRGQAHLLAGQANLWLKDFAAAEADLRAAYDDLARGGDETALAVVELCESQRRSFLGRGREALILGRRSRETFEERGLADFAARAAVVEGLALTSLGQYDEAAKSYREALPVFEKFELWSNYVGGANSLATALYKAGRMDEARREFARVLKRLSRREHRAWLGYLRQGFGDILMAAGRYRESASAFARAAELYEQSGLHVSAIIARLSEAESWKRAGSAATSVTRLKAVAADIDSTPAIDPSTRRSLAASLERAEKDVEEIAWIREHLPRLLRA